MNFLIREADPEDASGILEYIEKVSGESDFLTFGPGEFGISLENEKTTLSDFKSSPSKLFIVAIARNRIIGVLTFSAGGRPRVQHVGEFGISVLKEYWSTGVGTALISQLLKWAQQGGVVKKINLKVQTENARAIELYQKMGFEIEGTVKNDIRIGGRYLDNHVMGIFLGESMN
jgi:RimJ/RimL family protein N-acetyltransferase